MTNPNEMRKVLLFVCFMMADETNLSSKLPVADRTWVRKKALLVMLEEIKWRMDGQTDRLSLAHPYHDGKSCSKSGQIPPSG